MTAQTKPRKTVAKRVKKPDIAETLMVHRLLTLRTRGPLAVLEDITCQALTEDVLAPMEPHVARAHVADIRQAAVERIERWEYEAQAARNRRAFYARVAPVRGWEPTPLFAATAMYPLLVDSYRAQNRELSTETREALGMSLDVAR